MSGPNRLEASAFCGSVIPAELLALMLQFCDIETIFRSSFVSKKFYAALDEIDWIFVIHLHGWTPTNLPLGCIHRKPKATLQNSDLKMGDSDFGDEKELWEDHSSMSCCSPSCSPSHSLSYESGPDWDFWCELPEIEFPNTQDHLGDLKLQTIFWYLKREKLFSLFRHLEFHTLPEHPIRMEFILNNGLNFSFESAFQKFEESNKVKIPNELKDLLRIFSRHEDTEPHGKLQLWNLVEEWEIIDIPDVHNPSNPPTRGIVFCNERCVVGLSTGLCFSSAGEPTEGVGDWHTLEMHVRTAMADEYRAQKRVSQLCGIMLMMIEGDVNQYMGDIQFGDDAYCLVNFLIGQICKTQLDNHMGEEDQVLFKKIQVPEPKQFFSRAATHDRLEPNSRL